MRATTAFRHYLQTVMAPKQRARRFFLAAVLPAWLGPGLLDWWYHRRTRIEVPGHGGATESALHAGLFALAGIPILSASFFEMNPLVVTVMAGAAALHEGVAIADVKLARESARPVSQGEQHVHSFLEVMPFAVVPLTVLLHEPTSKEWALRRRRSALSRRDLALVGAAVAVAGVVPYAEEMLRCLRHKVPRSPGESVRTAPMPGAVVTQEATHPERFTVVASTPPHP